MATKSTTELAWTQSSRAVPSGISFLDLPRELRDLVYEHALGVSGAIFIYSLNPYAFQPSVRAKIVRNKEKGPPEPQQIGTTIPIALLRTCRQVHTECSTVLYGHNVYRLYMSNAAFAPRYLPLVRHITFEMDADHRIYGDDLDTVSYWWRRRFWAQIMEKSNALLQMFPNLETLTFPIKSHLYGQTWRPAFFLSEQKTREQRISLAASWMRLRCPFENQQLRDCLHLEIMPFAVPNREDYEGSQFLPEDEDWDHSEFAEAFERMKMLG
ncbi:hypothetical protein CC78DRAFT_549769 [Lojkania enalia]|uniref:DUF7730 domain-containing protein n=1 Tax=Lojkania enalia TaxID=147567 RepID=A0A9P4JXR5_9PLEO|nr:hypothetical protein CC78DRAFT_549769 [Didymosphaeria enalia]